MDTVAEIVDAVGTSAFVEGLRASVTAVSNMKKNNRIPAKKYRLAQRTAAQAGLGPIPDHLFTFDSLPKDQNPGEPTATAIGFSRCAS